VNERRVGGIPNPWRTLSPDSVPAHESLPLCHLNWLPPTGTSTSGIPVVPPAAEHSGHSRVGLPSTAWAVLKLRLQLADVRGRHS
jgi:hypothetical protein